MIQPGEGEAFELLPLAEMSVDLVLCGLRLRLEAFPVAERPFLAEHYAGFYELSDEGRPADLRLHCELQESPPLLAIPSGDEPARVELEHLGVDSLRTRSHWHSAEVDYAVGEGKASFHDRRGLPFRMSLENLLRVTMAGLLLRHDACLLHAAGVLDGDDIQVFFGLSGSGKSRLTQLSAPRPALSDDLIALRLDSEGLRAERVPFFGEHPSADRLAGSFPVPQLLHLERAARHELLSLPAALQVLHLRSCMPFLAPEDQRALEWIEQARERVAVKQLRFADDAGFWELV